MVVGEGLRIDRAVQNSREEFGFLPAPIEAEHELVQVALKMLRTDIRSRAERTGQTEKMVGTLATGRQRLRCIP